MFMRKSLCVCMVLLAQGTRAASNAKSQPEVGRLDSKVRFVNDQELNSDKNGFAEQIVPFSLPQQTAGFYNRPGEAGRYPVKAEHYRADDRVFVVPKHFQDENGRFMSSGGGPQDTLTYYKCTSTPDCKIHPDMPNACGPGRYLCCYNRPIGAGKTASDVFDEVEDERLPLSAGNVRAGPFPLPGQEYELDHTVLPPGPGMREAPRNQLVPPPHPNILVGPGQTSNYIENQRPYFNTQKLKKVLVGPAGPTGMVGPQISDSYPSNVLFGPEIDHLQPAESAQSILVGPGGPTGIIGPGNQGRQGILVGPGGPTGIIGPRRYNYDRVVRGPRGQRNRGVLVGPGGPTGIIGPGNRGGRQGVLVGPGGPTGIIGPGGPTGYLGSQSAYFDGK